MKCLSWTLTECQCCLLVLDINEMVEVSMPQVQRVALLVWYAQHEGVQFVEHHLYWR